MEPLNPKLTLSKDEMKSLGYRVIDMLVEHFDTLPEQSPVANDTRQSMD